MEAFVPVFETRRADQLEPASTSTTKEKKKLISVLVVV